MKKTGFTLIVAVMLMTLLAITAFSLITFVIERSRLVITSERETNAYYMAQAGIHYGIYQYRRNGTTSGSYNNYADRKFEWQITSAVGNIITIRNTGYSPASGNNQIRKTLEASYNTSTRRLAGLRYGN